MTILHDRRYNPLNLERLEARETPAGNLTSFRSGSSITLTGTDDFEQFQIQAQATPGSFRFIGQNGTRIDGATAITFTNVTSMTFNLRGGNDQLSLDASINPAFNLGGSLTFNGGDGNNSLALGGLFSPASNTVTLGGNLLVTNGDGDDAVTLQAGGGTVVQGRVSLGFGDGDSNISVGKLAVNGIYGLTVTAGAGADTARFSQLNVVRDAAFYLGTGGGSVTINSSPATSTIGGNLTVQVLDGDGSFTVGDKLTVTGGVNLNLGEIGTADFGGGTVMVNSVVASAQNLAVTTSGKFNVLRDASFSGSSSAIVDIRGATNIGGSLTYRGGSGGIGNRFAIDSFANSPLVIGGNATFFSGRGGFNEYTIASGANAQSTIGGYLSIYGGSGTEQVTLDNIRVGQNALVLLGSGNNHASFGQGLGPVEVRGGLTVESGNGKDSVQFFNAHVTRSTSINLGAGADSVSIADSTFAAFVLNTGDGDDSVQIEPAFFGTGAGTTFLGAVNVSMGNGNDTLAIGDNTAMTPSVTFGKPAFFYGNAGLNTFASNLTNFTGMAQFFGFVAPI